MTAMQVQPDTSTMAPATAAIEALGLGKEIDDRVILSQIDLTIAPGQYVALMGANGAGKSTLLKILATLTPSSGGELRLFGHLVGGEQAVAVRAKIGLIGHQSMLYRDLSARENLEFFARLYGIKDPRGRAQALLETVDLANRAEDPVKAFSRGMTQRLAIARALVHSPQLLLADEPFDGLDAPSSRSLELLLARLNRGGMTIVLANHDIDQCLRLAQRAVVLRRGQVAINAPTGGLDGPTVLREMEGSLPSA